MAAPADVSSAAKPGLLRGILTGAVQAFVAWTAYGVVEFAFWQLAPWLSLPASVQTLSDWRATPLLFAVYAVAGIVLGGACGAAVAGAATRLPKLMAASGILSLVLVWMVLLGTRDPVSGLAACVVLAAVVVSCGRGRWGRRVDWLANPWSASLLLLGPGWINNMVPGSLAVKAGLAVAYVAAVYGLTRLARRWARFEEGGWKPLMRLAGALACVATVVFYMDYVAGRAPAPTAAASAGVQRPNVILIVMDTARAENLSLYGYERDTTPNLKKLAEEATVYRRATSPSDMTLSSHASLFTGLYSRAHGAHWTDPGGASGGSWGAPLSERFRTLPEILRDNGFSTMAVVANFGYLGHRFGLYQGFQHYVEQIVFLPSTNEATLRRAVRSFADRPWAPASRFTLRHARAEEVNRSVARLLEQVRKSGNPFFLFANYMDTHDPYTPPAPFDTLYPGKDPRMRAQQHDRLTQRVLRLQHRLTPAQKSHLISQYDGGIAYLDSQLGNLFGRLKQLGLWEKTMIVITSDHGEAFGERDLMGHAMSVYQDVIHVPLLIRYPEQRRGEVSEETVSLVDLMPTIVDAAGLEPPAGLHGRILRRHDGTPRIVLSESFAYRGFERFNRVERALFYGPLKLIRSTAGKRELYDLSADPKEQRNLYRAGDKVSQEMEAKLSHWLATVPIEKSVQPDREALERLKSLGYIQ